MKKLLIYAIFAVSAVMFYQNRYRLMNTVLSQYNQAVFYPFVFKNSVYPQ